MAPAPRFRVPKGAVVADNTQPSEQKLDAEVTADHEQAIANGHHKPSITDLGSSPKPPTYLMRRRSSGRGDSRDRGSLALPLRTDDPEVLRHLKHLGPSNSATRPKQTRINTVKIKPGIPNTIPENGVRPADGTTVTPSHAPHGGIGEGLLESAGREASDGVHSLVVGYGTISQSADRTSWKSGRSGSARPQIQEEPRSPKHAAANETNETNETTTLIIDNNYEGAQSRGRSKSVSTIGSLHSHKSRSKTPPRKRHTARSGSISENIVDVNGVKKIILETNSSSDSDQKRASGSSDGAQAPTSEAGSSVAGEDHSGKKKRKKRGKKKKSQEDSSESQPLLGGPGN
jgi:metal transporter CNNM